MELCFYAHYFGHLCSPPLRFSPEKVSVEVWGADSEKQEKRWHLTGLPDKEISTRAKMLIEIGDVNLNKVNENPSVKTSMPNSFIEYQQRSTYAKSTKSKKISKKKNKFTDMTKINSFFDPTKKNFETRVFRSFTQEYFNHLLKADIFRNNVIVYLKEKFVVDFMKDYPSEISKKLERNRFHMLDLQKKKSKFLWNRYELLVALEYFKEKYCKRILSNDFTRSIKHDPMSLDIETYENKNHFSNHQSGLISYFGNNRNMEIEMMTNKNFNQLKNNK
jgi:hypothetical protein